MAACLCEYCANIELLLKALQNKVDQTCETCAIIKQHMRSKDTMLLAVLCPPEQHFFKHACVHGECNECSDKLKLLLQDLKHMEKHTKVLQWYRWHTDKTTKKLVLGHVTGSLDNWLELLEEDCIFMRKHLFTAKWQHFQGSKLMREVPKGCVVQVIDFGQNYSCIAQDEPQAMA